MRPPRYLALALALALAGVAVLTDRALVGQAESARAAALARLDEAARETASTVAAALAQVEQAAASERPPEGTTLDHVAVPPPLSVPPRGFVPYGARSRAALAELLSSRRPTPSGLPEAVVARLALGQAVPVSGAEAPLPVEERLLAGDLPVRPEDLPYLAERLGIGDDPRTHALVERLREAPAPTGLPLAPSFRRQLDPHGRIEGWARTADARLLRYGIPASVLLRRAQVDERAEVPTGDTREPARGATWRIVPVPDVPGLSLRVTPPLPGTLRLATLRGILWLAAAAGAAGLVALQRAQAREARAVARERAFLAGVTHELRTPLTSIRVLGETLADGRGHPQEYGALVAQESERLSALVERVLTATRVEQIPRFGPVDPAEVLSSAVAVVGPKAARRGTRIGCRRDGTLPDCLWDRDAVHRALLNLLDNAVSHGREGGRVEARAQADEATVRLSIADDGPGIGRRDRRRIFGRFERGRTDAPGTGLGLFLVEEVARAHGGRVDLETGEGRGATFTLVLPARPPGAEKGPA